MFRCQKKYVLPEEIFSGNKNDTTNTFLDMSWPKEAQKIGPMSNEHTDFEI